MNLEDIGPILETKDMGVIFEGRKVEKCVNEETLSKDCQNQWNIVIFEKEKFSWPNELIMCSDYPIFEFLIPSGFLNLYTASKNLLTDSCI